MKKFNAVGIMIFSALCSAMEMDNPSERMPLLERILIDRYQVPNSIPVQQLIQPKKLKSYLQLLPPELRYQMLLHLDIEEPGALTLLKYGVAVSDDQKFELGKDLLHLNPAHAKRIGNPIFEEACMYYLQSLKPIHKAIEANDTKTIKDYLETAVTWERVPTLPEISEIPEAKLPDYRMSYHYVKNIITAMRKPFARADCGHTAGEFIRKSFWECPGWYNLCANSTILAGLLIYGIIKTPGSFNMPECGTDRILGCEASSIKTDSPCNISDPNWWICCENFGMKICKGQQAQFNEQFGHNANLAWMPFYITVSALAFIQIAVQLAGCYLRKYNKPMSPEMKAVIGEYESKLDAVKVKYNKEFRLEEV